LAGRSCAGRIDAGCTFFIPKRAAWNTQESIADVLGVPQATISDVVKSTEKRQLSIFGKEFKPML
jgi:predicted XRE-type DNA-binding protein